jgi:hypothetical protein
VRKVRVRASSRHGRISAQPTRSAAALVAKKASPAGRTAGTAVRALHAKVVCRRRHCRKE